MGSITGIELGMDSCVLVRARQRRQITEVGAVHAIEAGEWPDQDVALVALLRGIRREKHLPRRARVVAWYLPESASISDPAVRGVLRPLMSAGFRIEHVLSPPQALAHLASTRYRSGDATAAWLALNRHGAAIAIVRGSELLFSRSFDWSYRNTTGGANARLLERYSLVAQLAPELRRGMDLVRSSHGVQVESAITCGDLPDLRSLTMPLIEELDLEVETLDSVEGLAITAAARTQRVAELAPALRLACAAATATPPVRRVVTPMWLKVAAASIVVAGLGWWGYSRWTGSPVRPVSQQAATPRPAPGRAAGRASQRPAPSANRPATPPARSAASSAQGSTPSSPPPGTVTTPQPNTAKDSRASLPPSSSPPSASTRSPAPPTTAPPTPPASRPSPLAPPASRTASSSSRLPEATVSSAARQTGAANPSASNTSGRSQQPTVPARPQPVPSVSEPNASARAPEPSAARSTAGAGRSSTPGASTGSQPAPSRAQPSPSVPDRIASARVPQPSVTPPTQPAPLPRAAPQPPPPAATGSTSTPSTARSAPAQQPATTAPPKVEPAPADIHEVQETANPSRPKALPKPMNAPVPAVSSILIAADRRLAVIDGRIVGVGDTVGPRVVARIEQTLVVLREPSGFELRVPLR